MKFYIETYLYDCIGLTPSAAVTHLQESPSRNMFRSFRIQADKHFNPNIYDLAPPEEPEHGRVTFRLKDAVVEMAYYEHLSNRFELLKPAQWPPSPPAPINHGEVFVLSSPDHIGYLPVRQDIHFSSERPQRGWQIETIESYYYCQNQSPGKPAIANLPPALPRKPTIMPDFIPIS